MNIQTGTCICSKIGESSVTMLNLTSKLLENSSLTIIDTTGNYKTTVQRLEKNVTSYTLS